MNLQMIFIYPISAPSPTTPHPHSFMTTYTASFAADAATPSVHVVPHANVPDGVDALWLVGFALLSALTTEGIIDMYTYTRRLSLSGSMALRKRWVD
ncbi:hypothetical protein Naga_100909g1 [Nannochloropsis gaditana]|uniref:Uncharacterized protein n=1 Tax=Nannochloropsis gaditana TaxID=72520 RepID=W7T670_9STRA|nr:hypothetical protein Naga_100909g1 [Nannochloropsis gaditana]